EVAARCRERWTEDHMSKVAAMCLPNPELGALIVQGILGLVCASLAKDSCGGVELDTQHIVRAFSSFLSALEEYEVEAGKLIVHP
ncbi:hypothetical protein BDN67DRAFT_870059, partial [Paxillus ammoniavirescens]